MNYAIISTNTKSFWSNLDGWVSFDNADIFDASEVTTLNLPCDGEWVPASEFEVKTVSELAPLIHQKEKELWGDHKIRKRVSDADPMELAEFARQHLLQPAIVPREMRFSAAQNRNPDALINRMRSLIPEANLEHAPA
jgi:hypothetical protein